MRLFIFGAPAKVGGAATKIRHLLYLLKHDFEITLVLNDPAWKREKEVTAFLKRLGIPWCLYRDLPRKTEGVALVICEPDFFRNGWARRIKERGLRLVFSNEMMFPFAGEAEAVRAGLIDKVLFVSEFQRTAFRDMYREVPWAITGNYIAPDEFPFTERRHPVFTLGRLSRADPDKYPEDFPVFYKELGLKEVRYRVMAWDDRLRRKYRWFRFGPEWDLLAPQREPAVRFLHSLDLLVYPIGHRVKESWGRSTVEAMLTGCIPLVPAGHQFENLVIHGETGFVCRTFGDYKGHVEWLYHDGVARRRLARRTAAYAREHLCDAKKHREIWRQALTE